MTEQEQMKALIRGASVENNLESEFNKNLSILRGVIEQAKANGGNEEAACYMALAYVCAEIQS
jgi:hypothetical protein